MPSLKGDSVLCAPLRSLRPFNRALCTATHTLSNSNARVELEISFPPLYTVMLLGLGDGDRDNLSAWVIAERPGRPPRPGTSATPFPH